MSEQVYLAIDLKSFYASVECVERGLDPLTTNLVVADKSRTEKTICLAVTPSLKAYGLGGRCRLFEVNQKLKEVRAATGEEVTYITATPRMQLYVDYSTRIYSIYLKYVSHADIHVYSIDECFIDVTHYLSFYQMTAHELAKTMIRDIYTSTGITATAGIGTNLYLAKVAMDIVAKHVEADGDGVRIAELNEGSYRRLLWNYTPLTSFWRIGPGISRRLEENGMYTMGDIARMSLSHEDLLFRLFGIDAELLIDHAWGVEPCAMEDIKNYKPETNSFGAGQVLSCPYSKEKGRLVVREMVDSLVLDMVDKGLVTDQVILDIGYDRNTDSYQGSVHIDHYGRKVPKPAHGSVRLDMPTSSTKEIMDAATALYDQIVDESLSLHRITVTFNHVVDETEAKANTYFQYDLFTDPASMEKKQKEKEREKKMQRAMLQIKSRYGKNAILRGISLEEGATAMERNRQIGGHKA